MRVRNLLPLLLILLCLCACGREGSAEPEFLLPEGRRLAPMSLEESQAMARFLNANRALVADGFLYCYDFGENWEPALARYRWDGTSLKDYTLLAEGCVPEYLCREGGKLYYIDRRTGGIERVPEQGGAREAVRPGPCDGLILRDGLLCFRDGEGRFLALDPDTGAETPLLDLPCAWAYPLAEAILYRESGADGRLRLRWTEDGADEELSAAPASTPLILEDRLYYRSGGILHSVGLDGREATVFALPETDGAIELLPEAAGLSLRGIRDENGPVQWAGPPEGPFQRQARGYRICDWLGGGLRIDTVYEPDGRIRCFLLTDESGRQLSFLAGATA